jgi:hypothetical protein
VLRRKDENGAWKGRVLVSSGKDEQRDERYLDCDGVTATEAEAVEAATAWARGRMPEDMETWPARAMLAACSCGAAHTLPCRCVGRPPSRRKGSLNSHARLDRVRDFYRLNIGLFPNHLESVALEYCESYGSAGMAYVRLMSEQEFRGLLGYIRRQPRFAELDQDDCALIERLFRAGTTQTGLMDALDERRAAWGHDETPAPVAAL